LFVGPREEHDLTKIAHRHGENREPRKRDWRHIHHSPLFWVGAAMFLNRDPDGKDGAIRHVMSGVNPQGCRVYSFKQPTERSWNDFLWRTT
jgi:polyphosphate kinase 2 (PPK2 family)